MKGESNYIEMTMKIVRPTWDRTVVFKSWGKGTELSITIVTAPVKEKGQVFLKRNNDMWSWNPTIGRMIKPAILNTRAVTAIVLADLVSGGILFSDLLSF